MTDEREKKKKREKKTAYKILGFIADILMYPIMIISLVSSMAMLLNNRGSEIPSVFGMSLVKILSNSMVEDGFEVGDAVFVKKVDYNTLEVGDVIAFYKYFDTVDTQHQSEFVDKGEYDSSQNQNQEVGPRTDVEFLKTTGHAVYFHRVKSIKVLPLDGSVFFETVGSTPGDASDGFVRSDYVVGQYVNTPRVVRDAMKFCSSSTGMIILVVLPLSILVLLECLSIVEQVNNMITENRVFNREEPFDSPESLKAHIGYDMDLHRQVFFYATAKDSEREKVKDFLWGNLYFDDASKKELALKEKIEQSIAIFGVDKLAYFDFWTDYIKGPFEKNKYEKLKNEYRIQFVIKNKFKR